MTIKSITMPKWGLAMQEGTLVKWAVAEGDTVKAAQEIADIETSKIANVFESPVGGVVKRLVAKDGDLLPVGALLAVVAEAKTTDADVDAFVADFLANFKVEASSADTGPKPQVTEVGGKKLRYLAVGEGTGTPLLMIHGFGADLGAFMFNQAVLAEGRTVYAVDLPGHGSSAKDVGDGSPATLAADIAGFIEAIGLQKVHLAGHSLGGAIAVHLADKMPGKVASLSLIAPWGFGPEISSPFIEGFISEQRAKKLRPVLEMLVANPAMVTGDMVEDVLKFKRLDGALECLTKVGGQIARDNRQPGSVRDIAVKQSIPVAVIWGEEDQVLPAKHADGLPGAFKVHKLAGAGHIVHMEKANEVNAVIAALIA